MLKRIIIRNFQRWAKLDITLDKYVTTIVGPTDAGKSAVMRALRWVSLNTPSGFRFIRNGQKCAAVTIFAERKKIRRRRGKTLNEYHVDERRLVSFGNGVPSSISNVLRIGEDNFQGQYDSPFWLSVSAAQLSRNLNAIVDLSSVDDAIDIASKEVRRLSARISVGEERVAKAQEKWDSTRDVESIRQDLRKIERLAQRSKGIRKKIEGLSCLLERVTIIKAELSVGVPPIESVSQLERLAERREKSAAKIKHLRSLIQRRGELAQDVSETDTQLRTARKRLSKIPVCPTCGQELKNG